MKVHGYSAVAALLVCATASCSSADTPTSGLAVGDPIGSYSCTKGGGVEDGVEVGKSLCYTWKLGGRPVVFAFAKTPSDALASLAKQVDKLVADNQEKKLAAVINFTGEPTDDYKAKIVNFGTKHNLKNVALTITADAERFKVNDQAEVTVMHYKGKTVKANQAIPGGSLNAAAVNGIIEGAKAILD